MAHAKIFNRHGDIQLHRQTQYPRAECTLLDLLRPAWRRNQRPPGIRVCPIRVWGSDTRRRVGRSRMWLRRSCRQWGGRGHVPETPAARCPKAGQKDWNGLINAATHRASNRCYPRFPSLLHWNLAAIAKPEWLHPEATAIKSARLPASGDTEQNASGHFNSDFARFARRPSARR